MLSTSLNLIKSINWTYVNHRWNKSTSTLWSSSTEPYTKINWITWIMDAQPWWLSLLPRRSGLLEGWPQRWSGHCYWWPVSTQRRDCGSRGIHRHHTPVTVVHVRLARGIGHWDSWKQNSFEASLKWNALFFWMGLRDAFYTKYYIIWWRYFKNSNGTKDIINWNLKSL